MSVAAIPLQVLTEEQRRSFETPEQHVYPEIGSRAFVRAVVVGRDVFLDDGWQVIQPGRFLATEGPTMVRMVLSEYLACEVVWN